MAIAAVLIGLLAGLPLVATVITYVTGRDRGDAGTAPLSPAGMAAGFVYEWVAATVLLAAGSVRRPVASGAAASRVAVLIPERYCSPAGFWYLRRRLRALGWECVWGIDRASGAGAAETMAALDARIAALPSSAELVLLGHGIGGELAYHYARARPALRIRRIFTLATPHQGSRALPYRLLRAAMPAVSAIEASAAALDVVTIYSDFDAWLVPVDDAYCPGAFNIAVRGVGHCATLLSRRVADLIAENLPTRPPADPA